MSERGKHAEAEAAFARIAAEGTAGYRVLARLRGCREAAARDPQAGGKLYDAIAADRVGATAQDLARVRAAGLLMETEPYEAIRQRLEPASGPTGPIGTPRANCWRCRHGAANDAAAARQWLDMIGNDAQTPRACAAAPRRCRRCCRRRRKS